LLRYEGKILKKLLSRKPGTGDWEELNGGLSEGTRVEGSFELSKGVVLVDL
jgi:hypothetical protein